MFILTACSGSNSPTISSTIPTAPEEIIPDDSPPPTDKDNTQVETPDTEALSEDIPLLKYSEVNLANMPTSLQIDSNPETQIPSSVGFKTDEKLKVGHFFSGRFTLDDTNLDSQLRFEIKGRSIDAVNYRYFFRVRKQDIEAYSQSRAGSALHPFGTGIISKNYYYYKLYILPGGLLFQIHDFNNALLGSHLLKVKDFKIDQASFELIWAISKGNSAIDQIKVETFEYSDELTTASIINYLSAIGIDENSLITTEAHDLFEVFKSHEGILSNTLFYKTFPQFEHPIDSFPGHGKYWQNFGGRSIYNLADKKVALQYKFKLSNINEQYCDFRLYESQKGKVSYIVNNGELSIVLSHNGQTKSKKLFGPIIPNKVYNLDLFLTTQGHMSFIYPEESQRPLRPQHIHRFEWLSPRSFLGVLRGTVDNLSVEKFETPEQFQNFTSLFADVLEDKNVLKSSLSDDLRWVIYQDSEEMQKILNSAYAKWYENESPQRLQIKSDGTHYENYTSAQVLQKGTSHHFRFSFLEPELDPIFILGLEGKNSLNQNFRHALVFRNNRLMSQFRPPNFSPMISMNLSGMPDINGLSNFNNLSGVFNVVMETFSDGTAFFIWKEGEERPAKPQYIIDQSPFNDFNWKAWTFRNTIELFYLGSTPLQDQSYKSYISQDSKIYVSVEETIFEKIQWSTLLNGIPRFNDQTNIFTHTSENQGLQTILTDLVYADRNAEEEYLLQFKAEPATSGTPRILFEFIGSTPKELNTIGSPSRQHILEWYQNRFYVREVAHSLFGGHGIPIDLSLVPNEFYNLKVKFTPQGSSITLSSIDAQNPTPQSIFFEKDFQATMRIRIQDTTIHIKDYHRVRNIESETEATQPSNNHGANLLAGTLTSSVDLNDANVSIISLMDTNLMTNYPCWQLIGTRFQENTPSTLVLKSDKDPRGFWEALACTIPLSREHSEKISLNFKFPDNLSNGSQYIIGIQGYAHNNQPRRHILLFKKTSTTFKGFEQIYTKLNGHQTLGETPQLNSLHSFKIEFTVNELGSHVRLLDQTDNAILLDHDVQATNFPGVIGVQDSQVNDYPPFFFIRNRFEQITIDSLTTGTP